MPGADARPRSTGGAAPGQPRRPRQAGGRRSRPARRERQAPPHRRAGAAWCRRNLPARSPRPAPRRPPQSTYEAVRTVVATLESFKPEDQERIIRWAREKLGLSAAPAVAGAGAEGVVERITAEVGTPLAPTK